MTADLTPILKTQLICLFDDRAVEARTALFKDWDRMSDLANEDNLRADNSRRHAVNRQVQHPRQQEACEYLVAFLTRKGISWRLISETFGLRGGKIMFYEKCNASPNVKGQIENVGYLSTVTGPIKDFSLICHCELFGREDPEQDQKTGSYTESWQTPGCLGVCTTPHRVSDGILAEAEGEPEHTTDGVIIGFKRWISVNGRTVDKDRSKITAP
ncbi:hypothetical protein LTS10_004973 [Elasticomyces elasticus]|nr:hypothetical protein LTS10_004973 [Elasticomyces elasticus]